MKFLDALIDTYLPGIDEETSKESLLTPTSPYPPAGQSQLSITANLNLSNSMTSLATSQHSPGQPAMIFHGLMSRVEPLRLLLWALQISRSPLALGVTLLCFREAAGQNALMRSAPEGAHMLAYDFCVSLLLCLSLLPSGKAKWPVATAPFHCTVLALWLPLGLVLPLFITLSQPSHSGI